jgi:hypothetical protein
VSTRWKAQLALMQSSQSLRRRGTTCTFDMGLADWLVDGAFDKQTFEVDVVSAFKTDTTGHSVGYISANTLFTIYATC